MSISPESDGGAAQLSTSAAQRGDASVQFSVSFMPLGRGFARVGGLRVLLVEDRDVLEEEDAEAAEDDATLHAIGSVSDREARVLREWDVVGEVWVT